MKPRRLLGRVAFAVVSVYVALTAMFVLVTVVPNVAIEGKVASASLASRGDLNESELQALRETYRAARGLDRPVWVRYVGWLVDMTTLQWGLSFSHAAPVTALVADRLERTLEYAVPGIGLAVVLSGATGLISTVKAGGRLDTPSRVGWYALLGVPNFWLVAVFVALASLPVVVGTVGELPPIVYQRVLPALLLATTLVAGQLSFLRSEIFDQRGSTYLLFLRAKGLGRLAILWRAFRNAAVPLLTLFLTEWLGIFVIAIYVIEFALGIPGLGRLTYEAAFDRDMPLLLGTTLVVVVAGALSNLVQDLSYEVLDPRTREDR